MAPIIGVSVFAESDDVSEGERKLVTALFADIKGSTELMEDLDPEDARRVIDPALKIMIEAVNRYDGYVVQSTGDGIFALFGAPIAHEDHPQRAVLTALRMQQEIKRLTNRLRAEGHAPLQIRIGLNTGEVVVRPIQTGAGQVEYTPIGHTANLASRMQTLADPGSVVTSETTHRLCQGYFAFKALGPVRVKGTQRAGQCLRGDGDRSAQDPAAAFRRTRAHEVRWARARDGRDAPRARAGQAGARADRRRDWRGGAR